MVSFCIVQSLYLIRLGLWDKPTEKAKTTGIFVKKFLRNIAVTVFILILLLFLRIKPEALILVTCFYFVSIMFNVIDSVIMDFRGRNKYQFLYSSGMVLFLLCDLNVGVFNLTGFVSVNSNWFQHLYNFSTVAMWLFYLPAQVFISLSGQSKDMLKLTK